MRFWGNLIGYQLVWFAAVIGAAHDMLWPALASMLLFTCWQLVLSDKPGVELRLLAVALLCGMLLDGALAVSGLAQYTLPQPALPPGGAPLWILALWLSFAMTLTQTLRYLQSKPWLASAFGAVGGPLAYLGAARGWSVVEFAVPQWRGLLVLAIGWGLAMPLLSVMARHWSHPAPVDTGLGQGQRP